MDTSRRPKASPRHLRVRSFIVQTRLNAYENAALERFCKRYRLSDSDAIRYALFGDAAGLSEKGEVVAGN